MEINGTVFKILPQQEVIFGDGTKKRKGGFVITREGDYPKPVAFELFGEERLSMLIGLTIGMPVKVSFIAESREGKNGNYYTTLRCFKIIPMMAAPVPTPPLSANPAYVWDPAGNTTKQQTHSSTGIPYENDLPFDDDLPMF